MFTGIIEHVGRVVSRVSHGGGARLAVAIGPLASGTAIGDSIAIDGACMTVTSLASDTVTVDCSSESLARTTLGSLAPGSAVNLERALRMGDRLGGHLVSGHVDGIGAVASRIRQADGSELWRFRLPAGGVVRVVEKGSVAIHGISLTSFACQPDSFAVALIPHTLSHTVLGDLQPGAPVNMEEDLVGRWILTHGNSAVAATAADANGRATPPRSSGVLGAW
jgi:riboflavin synthase